MLNSIDLLRGLLNTPEALTAAWRQMDRCDDDCAVIVSVGAPNSAGLSDYVKRYEGSLEVPFPPTLQSLLSTFNGLWVGCNKGTTGLVKVVASNAFGEPHIWPIGYGDMNLLADIELEEVDGALLAPFAEIADSGFFAYAATGHSDEPVYWVDRKFSLVAPHLIAPSLETFIQRYCDASLCLPHVLETARVPGWGE